MTLNKDEKIFDWIKLFQILALLISAFSLILLTLTLRPVAKWANYQSTCVEKESIKAPIEWAVRKCNGRSKVYQVK